MKVQAILYRLDYPGGHRVTVDALISRRDAGGRASPFGRLRRFYGVRVKRTNLRRDWESWADCFTPIGEVYQVRPRKAALTPSEASD